MVNNRHNRVQNLLKPARGQALVEYALILVLLAMALSFAIAATGPAIGNVFCNVVDNLAGEQSTDICGRGAGALAVEGGAPQMFWETVTWVAANPQGETPFPTPIRQPPTSDASVYNSPTPSQTPSNTPTPTNTHTPTITPTVTIGPSPTPSDLEFEVPHVDQIARPEWWRLASGTYWLGDGALWTAQYYDSASGFGGTLNLSNPRGSATYAGSDLNFNWLSGYPTGVGLTHGDSWGAVFTRDFTVTGTIELAMTWTGDDHTQVFVDGTQVGIIPAWNGTATGTRTLAPGPHTVVIRYGESGGGANMSFSATATESNPDDVGGSCPWGQVNNSNDSNSATFQFENKAAGTWTAGATCNLELRGWVDINGVTNPVLSFWDVWDFVGATADAKLQVAEYVTDVNGFFDRANAVWTDVNLHSGGSSNYNWTRYEVPIGSYGGTSGKVTFRFVLTGNGANNFRWHIDDLQILSESLSPGTFTVGNTWNLNARSQMNDFIYNSDSSKTIKDNPSLPDTTSTWRWDLTSTNTHGSGTAWDDSPGYTYLRHSAAAAGSFRESYLEFKKLIDLSAAPAADHESDTGNVQLSFWMAYDIASGGRLQVEYTRDARDTAPDNWQVVPNGGLLLNYTSPVSPAVPGPNEQTARTALVMQYFEIGLQQIPNWDTSPFRLRFALSVDNTIAPSGEGWYIDDIAIDRQNASPYLAYPFYDDAETNSNLTSYWQNIGGAWGFTSEIPTQGATDTAAEISPGAKRTARAYSDSPNAHYSSNVTRSLEMRFPLDLLNDTAENLTDPSGRAAASEPILSFWHHREVGTGAALRFSVELWTPAIATWREIWFYAPSAHGNSFAEQDAWERIEINLRHALEAASGSTWAAIAASPATNDDDIKIRFKFVTDSTGSKDGIYVDEISIADANYPTFKVWPVGSGGHGTYADHVELLEVGGDGTGAGPDAWSTRWHTGGIWNATGTSTRTGSLGFEIAPNAAQYMRNAFQVLELAPIIDLTSTPTTTVVDDTFLYWWMRYDVGSGHTLRVQIAEEDASESSLLTNQYYGKMGDWTAWQNVNYSVDTVSNTSVAGDRTVDTWQRAQVNLNSYRGDRIRIRFVLEVPDNGADRDIYFDDFTIMHGRRNLGLPFSDMATSLNNWVPEGSWELTNQYFLDTGETDAGLGSYQWVGWLFDCESLISGSCTNSTSPGRYNTILNNHPTNPTTPTCADPQVLNPAAPVGPDCVTTLSFDFEDDVDKPLGGVAPDQFEETWAGRWVRRVDLEPGTYTVRIISRRGVRMWIDDVDQTTIAPYAGGPRGRPIDRWDRSGPTLEYATFDVYAPVTRYLTVEWFETDGDSVLDVAISKGSYSFTDSPNTPSGSGWDMVRSTYLGNSSLISNGYFNFTGSPNPVLGFKALYEMGGQTRVRTEVSTNGGFTWTTIHTIDRNTSRTFAQGWEQIIPVNFTTQAANQSNVMIRFRLEATAADSGNEARDGVWITDIFVNN